MDKTRVKRWHFEEYYEPGVEYAKVKEHYSIGAGPDLGVGLIVLPPRPRPRLPCPAHQGPRYPVAQGEGTSPRAQRRLRALARP